MFFMSGLPFSPGTFSSSRVAPANPLSLAWIAETFLRNQVFIWLLYGSLHMILIRQQRHGTDRKFNIRFMEKNKKFLFGDQVLDNVFWSCVSGGTFWTAYEVLYFWLAAEKSNSGNQF